MESNSIRNVKNNPNRSSTIFTSYNELKKNIIKIRGIHESEPWELFNSMGTKVLKGLGIVIDVEHLPSGLYLLEVRGELHRIIK